MLRFGLFTTYISEQSKVQMESIIDNLSFLLEFDDNYFREIYSNNPPLKRNYIEMQKKTSERGHGKLGGAMNLISGAANVIPFADKFAVLLGLKEEEEEKDKEEEQGLLKRRGFNEESNKR